MTYQGAELLVGVVASAGSLQSALIRQALRMRAEENQVFAAASFLVGANYLDGDDYRGQSAVLAPMALSSKLDGVLAQTGTDNVEGIVAARLDGQALEQAWDGAPFRPRHSMNMAALGPAVAEIFEKGLTIEQALHIPDLALPPVMEPLPPIPLVEPETESELEPEPEAEPAVTAEPEPVVEPEPLDLAAMESEAGQPDAEPFPASPPEPEAVEEGAEDATPSSWGESVIDALSLTRRSDSEE
jgi:hypothetical protein